MTELQNVYKLNTYFYMDSNQNILKYEKYCIISDCEKIPIYCNTHKLENMINVQKIRCR